MLLIRCKMAHMLTFFTFHYKFKKKKEKIKRNHFCKVNLA